MTSQKLVFAANSPALALGLDRLIANFVVISMDDSSVIDHFSRNGIPAFSLVRAFRESNVFTRNSSELLANPYTLDFMEQFASPGLIVFKNSAVIEQLARLYGWNLLAAEAAVGRRYENKLAFPRILKHLDIEFPPMFIAKAGEVTFRMARDRLGLPFVVQFAKGFSGRETHLVADEQKLLSVISGDEQRNVKCSSYISGHTVTVNACVSRHGIIVTEPFVQITGLPELTPYHLGSCGQDWSVQWISTETSNRVISIAEKIGLYLGNNGYKGIYGIDFIVSHSEESIFVIEANTRLTSSIPIFTDLQLNRNEIPLFLWHTDAFGWSTYEWRLTNISDIRMDEHRLSTAKYEIRGVRDGAQLILHNLLDSAVRVRRQIDVGIYKFHQGRLQFMRPSVHIQDISATDEFIIIPAGLNQIINPGIECARIQFICTVLATPNELKEPIHHIITALYEALSLEDEPATKSYFRDNVPENL